MNNDLLAQIENLTSASAALKRKIEIQSRIGAEAKENDQKVGTDISLAKDELQKIEKELQRLKWRYDQRMLSKCVKGESSGSEFSRWWMNRY